MRYGAGQHHHGAAVIDEKTAGEIAVLVVVWLAIIALGIGLTWLEEHGDG